MGHSDLVSRNFLICRSCCRFKSSGLARNALFMPRLPSSTQPSTFDFALGEVKSSASSLTRRWVSHMRAKLFNDRSVCDVNDARWALRKHTGGREDVKRKISAARRQRSRERGGQELRKSPCAPACARGRTGR